MDSKTCPLCGKPNGCMAGTGRESQCWCHSVSVPKELLEQIPAEMRMKACVCRSCVDRFNSQKEL